MTRQRTRCCRTGRAISGPKTGEQFVGVAKLNVIYAARPTDDRLQPGGAVPVRVGRHWLYRAECLSLLRLRGARQRLSRRAGIAAVAKILQFPGRFVTFAQTVAIPGISRPGGIFALEGGPTKDRVFRPKPLGPGAARR